MNLPSFRPKGKEWTAHVLSIMLVALLGIVSVMSIGGFVNLSNPAVSLFVGSLVGTIAGLLAAPILYYFGAPPELPKMEKKDETQQ